MKKKLNVAFIRRSSEQGFALPTAIGMGFVMILISATLVMRSQNDRVIASAQKNTAQSLLLSEVGVTRALAFLKQNSLLDLAEQSYNSTNIAAWARGIGASALFGASDTHGEWISVPGFGHFKIVSYSYESNTGIGTLDVLGTTDTDTAKLNAKDTDNPEGAKSSVKVEISTTTTTLDIIKWQR